MSQQRAVPRHVHLGAGRLGLGLIVPLLSGSAVLVNRPPSPSSSLRIYEWLKSHESYQIRTAGHAPTQAEVSYAAFHYADESEALRTYFGSSDLSLVTTATRAQNLAEAGLRLAEWLQYRSEVDKGMEFHLTVIAGENLPSNSSRLRQEVRDVLSSRGDNSTLQYIDSNVDFLNCLVDRICLSVSLLDEEVLVDVEDYQEWVIEVSSLEQRERLAELVKPSVTLASTHDFEFYYRRKVWLLNGIHLILAVLGTEKGLRTVGDALADSEVLSAVRHVQDSFAMALGYLTSLDAEEAPEDSRLRSLLDYNESVLQRLAVTGEDILDERILRELYEARVGRQRLSSNRGRGMPGSLSRQIGIDNYIQYLEKVRERVIVPSEAYLEYQAISEDRFQQIWNRCLQRIKYYLPE
jgi:mannitol-1-phosphate/altronate dehydrogenase